MGDVWFAFAAELVPLISVPFAFLGSPFRLVAIPVFFCAGVGWFMLDEPGWGFGMLLLRPAIAAIGAILFIWALATCLFGCSHRHELLFDALGIVWLVVAFLTPAISAVVLYASCRPRVEALDPRD